MVSGCVDCAPVSYFSSAAGCFCGTAIQVPVMSCNSNVGGNTVLHRLPNADTSLSVVAQMYLLPVTLHVALLPVEAYVAGDNTSDEFCIGMLL